jgi:hypothetical protein
MYKDVKWGKGMTELTTSKEDYNTRAIFFNGSVFRTPSGRDRLEG